MKLTNEQIQKVEEYLNSKKVNYIDVRHEILDHILTEIELLAEENKLSYEKAFEKVTSKWNKHLRYYSSYWLGITNGGPKFFIKSCVKLYSVLFYKSIIGITLFSLLFYGIGKGLNIQFIAYENYINIFFKIFFGFFLFTLLFKYYKIKRTKVKTKFSFLFAKQIMPNTITALVFLDTSFFKRNDSFNYLSIIILGVVITTLFIGNYLYKKHIETISFYKKVELK